MDMSISKRSMDIYRYIEISVYIHVIQMLQLPDTISVVMHDIVETSIKGVKTTISIYHDIEEAWISATISATISKVMHTLAIESPTRIAGC